MTVTRSNGAWRIGLWPQRIVHGLTDLLIPPACAACGAGVLREDGRLCVQCALSLNRCISGDYCQSCGEDHGAHLLIEGRCTACRLGKPALRFDRFVRVGRYDDVLRRLVLGFKVRYTLDQLLGNLMADAIEGRVDPCTIDYWVPIPSHWRRKLAVGYQPTALLAEAAVKRWSGAVVPALLATKYVRALHQRPGMSAAERAEAVRGVFAPARGVDLKGKRIGLIDDVSNTGATLREAKRALKSAGAIPFAAAVLARVSRIPGSLSGVDPNAKNA